MKHFLISLALAAAILATLAGYALACRFWPYTNCRKCEGSGKSRAPIGSAYRRCRKCKGTGERHRLGWHVLNLLLDLESTESTHR